jgi:hypothetical protein
MNTTDYLQIYNLEFYLLDKVCPRFQADGYLTAFDFFCIVVWKANRAKSKIAKRLLAHSNTTTLEIPVRELTSGLFNKLTAKERLAYLMQEWGFLLPMASAILAVLYPDEFTIYDYRVCKILDDFQALGNTTDFEKLWDGYLRYLECVNQEAPEGYSLRNKDRYLWGKSFAEQLACDLASNFNVIR